MDFRGSGSFCKKPSNRLEIPTLIFCRSLGSKFQASFGTKTAPRKESRGSAQPGCSHLCGSRGHLHLDSRQGGRQGQGGPAGAGEGPRGRRLGLAKSAKFAKNLQN